MRLIIRGELTDLNTYIQNERSNRYMGATVKRNNTAVVARYAKQQRIQSVKDSAYLTFHWYCKNKKKDKDNISFAKKFILDGLVQAGVLPNDGWNDIEGFKDEFYIDKQDPRIEVEIT